jgi:hypothetical protein
MPAGLYIFYQLLAANEALYIAMGDGEFPQNMNELMRLTIEGNSAQDWIDNRTMENVRLYYAAAEWFSQMDIELTPAIEAMAANMADSMWAQAGHIFEENHVSRNSIRLHALSQLKAQMVFEMLYSEGGEREIAREALEREFTQEYVYMEIFFTPIPEFAPEELDMPDEEFVEMVRTAFEALPSRLNNTGDEFADVAYEFERWLWELYGENPDDVHPFDPEDLKMFIEKAERAEFDEEFMNRVFAAPIGRAVIIEVDEYQLLFVIRRIDVLGEEGLFEAYRNALMHEVGSPEFEESLDALAALLSLQENRGAINRYRPARLAFEF